MFDGPTNAIRPDDLSDLYGVDLMSSADDGTKGSGTTADSPTPLRPFVDGGTPAPLSVGDCIPVVRNVTNLEKRS